MIDSYEAELGPTRPGSSTIVALLGLASYRIQEGRPREALPLIGEAIRVCVSLHGRALHSQQFADLKTRVDLLEARWADRTQGYEGAACGSCGLFKVVRNGDLLKCLRCGYSCAT
jgi:hypothetical protein